MGRKVGAIDIGTNSTRLLVAEVESGRVRPVHARMVITRLGEGIATGRLNREAIRRTIAVLCAYRGILREEGVEQVAAAATSAVRDAADRDMFLDAVRRETGIEVRVLSGEEEAALGYRGVAAGLEADPSAIVVLDVGGGSTEFVWTAAGTLQYRSLNVGAVRMTEQGADEDEIRTSLAPVIRELATRREFELVGVGGTITTLAAMNQQLTVYDPGLVHGYRLTYYDVGRLLAEIRGKSLGELRQTPGLQPERADIIEAGACIVAVVMRALDRGRIVVSEADILHGLALVAAEGVEIKPAATDAN